MANEIDALINVKDAAGVLNEIYPITKKENVQGLSELIADSLSGYAKKTELENYLLKSGGTMTGALILNGAPTADLQAATKKYVDDNAATNLPNITNALDARVSLLEAVIFNNITANPFLILFDDLDGVTSTGIWNESLQRIEC